VGLIGCPETSVTMYQSKLHNISEERRSHLLSRNHASRSICTLTIAVPPDNLSLTPLTSSAMKTLENTDKDPDGPKLEDEGDIQIENSCD
jgi:hypothetical protein